MICDRIFVKFKYICLAKKYEKDAIAYINEFYKYSSKIGGVNVCISF